MPNESSNRILFIVAHPYLRESRSNRAVVEAVTGLTGVTVHPLYDHYPYFHIDVNKEMALLESHQVIVAQHPFYWYSMPALMRHWLSEVFQPGWAYGEGARLRGKDFLISLTVGGPASSYSTESYNRFPMETYLAPWNQTAHLCGMKWHEPSVLYDSIGADEQSLRRHGQTVRERLRGFLES